jgi:NADH-quinone oxidoreductase subunit H
MKIYSRHKTDYKGLSKAIVSIATLVGRIAAPLLRIFAWPIFLAAIVVCCTAVWLIATYINPLLPWIVRDIIVVVGMLIFVSLVAILGIWGERKVSGHIQSRLGPMRTGGWHGWAQSLADGLKFVQKEDLIPRDCDRLMFRISPHMALIPPLCSFLVMPFGFGWAFRDVDISLLAVYALLGFEVLGVILAGWASNSKWSIYGAMREACQLVSYEIPMGLSLLVPVMVVGSMRLMDMGASQTGGWFHWMIFRNPLTFVAFFTYYIASLASCKRAPFDLPEGESELVAGYHTEYSGFRFVMFMFAEYMSMFAVSALAVIIFLGGWDSPFGDVSSGPLWFVFKCTFLIFLQMWIRWTLPRIRIDQVMHACIKYLLPLTMILFLASAVWELYDRKAHPEFLNIANIIRLILSIIGLFLVFSYMGSMMYGLWYRKKLLGRLVQKHLPGA